MLTWKDPFTTLTRIYHDHSYAFSESYYKNFVKNYYLQPSFRNPPEIATDTIENIDVGESEVAYSLNTLFVSPFTTLCDFTLKTLFGNSYENQSDVGSSKFEIPGIDLQDKSKYYHSYKSDEWIISDTNMKTRLSFILDEAYGSLNVLPMINEQLDIVNFNNAFRRISKRIYNTYAASHWRMDICSNAHAYLLEYLPDEYLVIYVECLRVMHQRKKIRTILEQLHIWSQNQKIVQRFSWPVLLDLLQQESEKINDDLSEFNWDLHNKAKPVIIHIYSERWSDSSRMLNFSRVLKRFATVVDFPFDDSGRLRKKFEALRNQLQMELKQKKSSVFVMGWDLGALLGLLSSIKIHGYFISVFCGVICIGLPLKGLKGERGIIPEDYIHLLSKETLIISGDISGIGNGDDIEDFKDRMKGRVNIRHINIGGCDHLLRLSSGYAMRYRINQDTIDRLILKNVKDFAVDQVLSSNSKRDELVEYNQSRMSDHPDYYHSSNTYTVFNSGSTDQLKLYNQCL